MMELSHFHRIFCYRVLYSSFWICCLCFMFLAGGFCSFHQIFSIIIVILCVCVLCVGVCYSVYLLWIKFQYRLLISFASAMAMWKEYIGKVSVFFFYLITMKLSCILWNCFDFFIFSAFSLCTVFVVACSTQFF